MSWFEQVASLLSPGWVGSLIGLGGLIAGVVLCIGTYVLTRKRTSLSYACLGDHLLGSSANALPNQITVQFNGNSIPRLTRSIFVFWNSGENTVSCTDIVQSDRLRIQTGIDGRVLSASVLKTSRSVNAFKVQTLMPMVSNDALLDFEYLDKNDGAVIEILHTSEERWLSIEGSVKGLPKGLKCVGRLNKPEPIKFTIENVSDRTLRALSSGLSTWVPIALGALMVLVGALMNADVLQIRLPIADTQQPQGTVVILAGIVYGCMGFFMRYSSRRRYPKSLHIDALE